jgi:hypothetical protein
VRVGCYCLCVVLSKGVWVEQLCVHLRFGRAYLPALLVASDASCSPSFLLGGWQGATGPGIPSLLSSPLPFKPQRNSNSSQCVTCHAVLCCAELASRAAKRTRVLGFFGGLGFLLTGFKTQHTAERETMEAAIVRNGGVLLSLPPPPSPLRGSPNAGD